LRAALTVLGKQAEIIVAELVPAVSGFGARSDGRDFSAISLTIRASISAKPMSAT